jgi:hypothetical protein
MTSADYTVRVIASEFLGWLLTYPSTTFASTPPARSEASPSHQTRLQAPHRHRTGHRTFPGLTTAGRLPTSPTLKATPPTSSAAAGYNFPPLHSKVEHF